MAMNKPFNFKQFTIFQDQCAMKIGTDGVLLGAWTDVDYTPDSILDIGSGTGILSLMMAQRTNAITIDAIEIDEKAYEQCANNFENSPWSNRLFCYHASLLEFVEEIEDTFDLIICNPPFYPQDFKSKKASRDLARFQDAMPFEHLIYAVNQHLSENGLFSVVITYTEEDKLTLLASKLGLYPKRITRVKGNPESPVKRSLLEFTRNKFNTKYSELVIETNRHEYTKEYIELTKDFYLKM